MQRRRKTEIVQVNLRLREELRQRVLRESKLSGYSFNAELVHLIEQGLEYAGATDHLEGQAAGMETQYRQTLEIQRQALSQLEAVSRISSEVEAMLKGRAK